MSSRTDAGNGFAIGAYLGCIAWGVTHLTGLASQRSIAGFFRGDVGVKVWASFLIVSAVLGLAAITMQRRRPSTSGWSWIEVCAAGSSGALLALYWLALTLALGPTGVVTTQIGFLAPSLGALIRNGQIVWRHRSRLLAFLVPSRAHPATDKPPPGDLTARR